MICNYEYEPETQTLRMNCLGCFFGPSIEDFDVCMAKAIDKLMELKKSARIILSERRDYEYDYKEVEMLLEIAMAIEKIMNDKIISIQNIIVKTCESCSPQRYAFLNYFMNELKYDPISAYKKLLREMRSIKVKTSDEKFPKNKCNEHYLLRTLAPIEKILEECKIIQLSKDNLAKHTNRALYRQIFHPTIRPNFMYTRYVITPPTDAELLERYRSGESVVEIYRLPGKTRKLYHIIPLEFILTEEEYFLLDTARRYIGRHEPREGEAIEPEKIRENLYRIGFDLLFDISRTNNIKISESRMKKLADILTRYTAGLGILELILADANVQDIAVNSPVGRNPIYIFHGEHLECETNIVPSLEDAESWATRFRLQSGRPLDEANPVLDTELIVPGGRARVAAITRSLSPDGLAFAFRRHRDKPWTFPLFINTKMIDPFSAGLMWFLIDGSRSLLIAGTRSSGKTSFLGGCMVQIVPKLRILTVEDTLELPVEGLRELGYNIERLKSRSVITHIETELAAEEALRTALRLGDSVLIVGEVRSSIPGWEEVLVIENGMTKRVSIEELENKNIKNYKIPTLGFDLKVGLKPLAGFVKHPERDNLLEVITKTGRRVTVTPDHSLFHATNFKITPIECKDLKKGDSVVIPASIPVGFNDIDNLDAAEILPEFRLENFEPDTRRAIEKLGWKKATEVAGVSSGDVYNYFRTAPNQQVNLPIVSFKNLVQEAEIVPNLSQLRITRGTGNSIPATIPVNEDFCRF